jgi:putative methionine-R-sulfoxide reductase with GAF domain/HAMP domain-containing protein
LNEPTLHELNFERADPRLVLFDAQGNLSAISQHHLKGSVGGADAECQACHQDAAALSDLQADAVGAASFTVDNALWAQAQSGQIALGQVSLQDQALRVAYAPLHIGDKSPAVFGVLLSTKATTDLRNQLMITSLAAAFLVVTIAALGAVAFGRRSIAQPLVRLAAGAKQIAGGRNGRCCPGCQLEQDEIGALATTFNNMTAQLRGVIDSLEARSLDQTSAEVSRAVTSVLDPDDLVYRVTQLIIQRFNFYYTAVFLIDETGRLAVLREATGEAGQEMKQRHHRLEVGGRSMVGYVTAQRRARVASDVDQEVIRFANPLLPDTRSEIALPLMIAERVIGALDVQSTVVNAFDDETVVMLQGLADQVTIALNNAREFQAAQLNARQSMALFEAVKRPRILPKVWYHRESPAEHSDPTCQFRCRNGRQLRRGRQTYAIITSFDANRLEPLENVGGGNHQASRRPRRQQFKRQRIIVTRRIRSPGPYLETLSALESRSACQPYSVIACWCHHAEPRPRQTRH